MATILRDNVDSPALRIGGVEDHVHILFSLSRKFAIMDVVQQVKTESTKWLKRQGEELKNMQWQGGYGAFSVSESKVEHVKQYISNQAKHHRRRTFQDEFRELCQRHHIALDERFAWD